MTCEGLKIGYTQQTDTLTIYTTERLGDGETIAPYLWIFHSKDEQTVVGVVIDRAYRQLGAYLFPDAGHENKRRGSGRDMAISYSPESDTLRLQTGEPPYTGYTEKTVAPGLCVNFDPEGWAMGVVIERAAELLRPYLLAESAGVA